MIRKMNLREDNEIRQILDLQRLSYRVEADLIGYADLPPLKDTLETLRSSNELFYGYFNDETLVGAISYEIDRKYLNGERSEKGLDICRLVVHPKFFRRGIGATLLQRIEELEDPDTMNVATGSKNTPALELYKRFRFVAQGEREVAQNIMITFLQKVKAK